MDMRMPVMDGREASRRIKVSPYGRNTIIIALTASSFEDERADILASGCDDFLRKPFEEDELFELMQKHLGLSFIYQDDAVAIRDTRAQVDSASLAALPDDVRVSLERASFDSIPRQLPRRLRKCPHRWRMRSKRSHTSFNTAKCCS
jgi:DNA-binding response OmpR family regulator